MYCNCCQFRIVENEEGVRFLDHDYHRVCLELALLEMNIHLELVRAGLDQPPIEATAHTTP